MARVINSPTRFAPNTACVSAISSRRIVRTARFFSVTDASFQKHLSSSLTPSVSRRQPVRASNSQTTTEKKPVSDDRMLVFVPPHPLIKHWVSVLRNEQTPCPIFKNAMAELGRLLIYEASRDWLPTVFGEIQSPMGVASVEFIDPREPMTITCPFRFKWEIEKDGPEEVTFFNP